MRKVLLIHFRSLERKKILRQRHAVRSDGKIHSSYRGEIPAVRTAKPLFRTQIILHPLDIASQVACLGTRITRGSLGHIPHFEHGVLYESDPDPS